MAQGNYQTTTGEVYKVTYNQPIKPADAGITRALERGGGLGKPIFADRIGYSAEVRGVDYGAKAAQKTDYEIRQDFYATERKRRASQSFVSQVKEDVTTAAILGQQARKKALQGGPEATRAEMQYSEFISTRGYSYAGIGIQKTGEFVKNVGKSPAAPTGTTYAGRVIEGTGTYIRTEPTKAVAAGVVSAGVGVGVGAAYGYGVRSIARAGAFRTAAVAQAVPNVAGVAAIGYEVGTKTPEQIGASIPAYAGTGVGFVKGYGQVVPNPNIKFSNVQEGVTPLRSTPKRITGTGTTNVKAAISEFGVNRNVAAKIDYSYSAKAIDTGVYAGRLSGTTQLPTLRGSSFSGRRINVNYDLGIKTGEVTTTGVINPERAFVSTSSTSNKETITTGINLQRNADAYTVRDITFSKGTVSGFEFQQVPVIGVRTKTPIVLSPQRGYLTTTRDVSFSTKASGSEQGTFTEGFKLLETTGAYSPPKSRVRNYNLGRKGQFDVGAIPRDTTFVEPTEFLPTKTTILNPSVPKQISFSGLNFPGKTLYGVRTTAFSLFNPATGTGAISRSGVKSSSLQTAKPSSVFKSNIQPLIETPSNAAPDYGSTTGTKTSTEYIPREIIRTGGQSSMRFDAPIVPPPVPAFPGLGGPLPNLYRPGGGSLVIRGKARGFQYAPSLTAVAFNIRGSSRGRLSGLEVRPLAPRVRRKKKR